jgi:hypothetical protein
MKKFLKPAWVLSLIFILSTSLLQDVSAGEKKIVDFQGKWKEGSRSLSPTNSISAFIDEETFFLHSETQRSDVNMCVSKDGVAVYEAVIPASMTDCFIINLTKFEKGNYIIELRNQWGDFLIGAIEI